MIAGGLCLAAVVGFFVVKTQYESKIRGNIEGFFASLPQPLNVTAENIDVSFLNKSVTLTNVKGTYTLTVNENGGSKTIPMVYTFDRITAAGINTDGFRENAGTARLFDSLVLANSRFTSPLAQSAVALYTFENVSGDARQLGTELAKALPVLMAANASPDFAQSEPEQKEFMSRLVGLLNAYETVTIGKSSFEVYEYSADIEDLKIDMKMRSGQAGTASLRKMSSIAGKDIAVTVNDVQVKMENLSIDEIILPSFVGFFNVLSENAVPDFKKLKDLFADQPFAVRNLRYQNLEVRSPNNGDAPLFNLGDAAFSYEIDSGHAIDVAFNRLDIPKSAVLNAVSIPEQALADIPDPVSFEGVLQLLATPQESGAQDIDCKKMFLKGNSLGEVSLSFAVNNLIGMPDPSGNEVKNFDLSLSDAGFSEAAFAVSGQFSGKTPEQARAAEVGSLRELLETDPDMPGKEIITGLASFLEKPGKSLRIVLAPPKPLSIGAIQALMLTDPSALGLTVTVSPE